MEGAVFLPCWYHCYVRKEASRDHDGGATRGPSGTGVDSFDILTPSSLRYDSKKIRMDEKPRARPIPSAACPPDLLTSSQRCRYVDADYAWRRPGNAFTLGTWSGRRGYMLQQWQAQPREEAEQRVERSRENEDVTQGRWSPAPNESRRHRSESLTSTSSDAAKVGVDFAYRSEGYATNRSAK